MYYGRVERSFSIPDDAEVDDVKAEFKDGVLRVQSGQERKGSFKIDRSEGQLMPSGLETRIIGGSPGNSGASSRESVALNIF